MLIDIKATQWGVSPVIMNKVVYCESHYDVLIQSGYYHKGIRENSWGLVQIDLDYNSVTKKQAQDPDFALDFLGRNLKEGKGNMWTCYRQLSTKV